MSRSRKDQAGGHKNRQGREYWKSRLHKHGETIGRLTKLWTHRKERRAAKAAERAALAEVKPAPAPTEGSGWLTEEAVRCVVCPACAFTFDAFHTDEGGGYSCPQCAENAQRTAREQAERERPVCRECNDHFDAASLCEDCVQTRDAIAAEKLAAVESRLAEVTAIAEEAVAKLAACCWDDGATHKACALDPREAPCRIAAPFRARLAKAKGEG